MNADKWFPYAFFTLLVAAAIALIFALHDNMESQSRAGFLAECGKTHTLEDCQIAWRSN